MKIIFSESSNLNNSVYGNCQAPIKMFLEKRGEEFEQNSVLKNLFLMGSSKNYGDVMTTLTAMSGFEPVGENGAYPLDGMQEGYQKFLKYQTWKDSFSVSKEMIEDGKLLDMRKQPAAFMTSYKRTRELFGAALYGAAMMGNGSVTFKGVKFDLTGADGSVKKVIVSDWIKNALGSSTITDSGELKDVENVKGDESYTMNPDGMRVWDAQGNDIYCKGSIDKELPVNLSVSYKLDGKTVSADELAGKSGKVTIRFDYKNNQYQTVTIDGKNEKIYVPFAMLTGILLSPTLKFLTAK